MDYLWRFVCCGQGQAQDDDNSLLVSELSSRDNNNNSNNQDNRLHQHHTNDDANETILQQIIDHVAQLSEMSPDSIQATLLSCLDFITSQQVKLYIITHLINTLPKTNKLETLRLLISTLEDKQRGELESIVTGLPASVFGDTVAREKTRVLVDLTADTKESIQIDRHRIAPQKKFVDTTIEMFQQALSSLRPSDYETVVIGILHQQPPLFKMKIILKNLVLSNTMQPANDSRVELMQKLLQPPQL